METENNQLNDKYEPLKLKNQLCFPIYAVLNKIVRTYKPFLEKLDLTYTQYITMMVLWEKKQVNEKTLGDCLFLKSNTLTPLLAKLEVKGYVKKEKSNEDNRNLVISITPKGEELRDKAVDIPIKMAKELRLSTEKAQILYQILYELLEDNRE